MTILAYYPGCSLEGTSKEYNASSKIVCQALGLELREVEDWNCCGGSSAHMTDHWLGLALAARNLRQVGNMGLDRVTVPCSACYERLRDAQHALANEHTWRRMAEEMGIKVEKDIAVEHILATLTMPPMLEKAKALLKRPLTGLKVACYYGCLITRPPELVAFDDVENPRRMDDLLAALGAEPIPWPFKTECCGAVMAMGRTDIVLHLSRRLLAMARDMGAEAIVAACPLCQANLDTRQGQIKARYGDDFRMPVYFFTQLMGLAFGCSPKDLMIDKHITDAMTLLQQKGLA